MSKEVLPVLLAFEKGLSGSCSYECENPDIYAALSFRRRVAYRVYSGSYSNAGSAFKELAVLAPHLRTFGIYYDDPRRVSCFFLTQVHRYM